MVSVTLVVGQFAVRKKGAVGVSMSGLSGGKFLEVHSMMLFKLLKLVSESITLYCSVSCKLSPV